MINLIALIVLGISLIYFILSACLNDDIWLHKMIFNENLVLIASLCILIAPFVYSLVPDNYADETSINKNPQLLDYQKFPKYRNKGILAFKLSGNFETAELMTEDDDFIWTSRNADSIIAIVLPEGDGVLKNISFEGEKLTSINLPTVSTPPSLIQRYKKVDIHKTFEHQINFRFNIEKGKVTYLGLIKPTLKEEFENPGISFGKVYTNSFIRLQVLNYDTIIIKDLVEWDLHGKLKFAFKSETEK